MNRIISFDVGIKNLAYCVFDINSSSQTPPPQPFSIIEWSILNLAENEAKPKQINVCDHKKNPTSNICGKVAKYSNSSGKNFCATCAKGCEKRGELFVCDKAPKESVLKTLEMWELEAIYKKYATITFDPSQSTLSKKAMANKVYKIIEERGLIPIVKTKEKSAKEINLVEIGRAIYKQLNEVLQRSDPDKRLTHVIIENQISPIATRMKTVQGMLAQYFIMTYPDGLKIDFVSSSNKLKMFPKAPVDPQLSTSNNYKQHKKDGVFYTQEILEKNEWLSDHIQSMTAKKKDDLADCFLQGVWYMTSKKRIIVAENLKINIVSLS
jgi:hypothetical protein